MKPNNRSNQALSLSRSVSFAFFVLLVLFAVGASAQPVEICDGIDNDGNGLVDEGFDVDGDGVARCCSRDPYFATTTNSNQQIEVFHRACGAGGFTQGITPAFDDPQAVVQLHGVGDFNQFQGLDILWRDVGVNWGQRNLTTCLKGEWQTIPLGSSDLSYFGGADMDLNGTLDVIGWYLPSFAGTTALNTGGFIPSFMDLFGTYDVSVLQGAWGKAYAYNLEDMTSDGIPDFMFWEYSSGGASDTEFHTRFGNGNGTFSLLTTPSDIVGQPQNYGDLGDLDRDGCPDWVGGPDDDGNRGVVMARLGDCAAGFSPEFTLVDTCMPDSSCTSGSTVPGMGMSQWYDWNCDGMLDLLTSRRNGPGVTSDILYWLNSTGPPAIAAPAHPTLSIKFASPLRN